MIQLVYLFRCRMSGVRFGNIIQTRNDGVSLVLGSCGHILVQEFLIKS